MAVKKTGLGKGLDALFSAPLMEMEEKNSNDVVRKLKVNEIEPNKAQARKVFDDEAIEDLASSIKEYGVIQPIIVSKKNDKYIPIYRDIENTFQGFFGTKVKLDAGERKGKIIIQYSSNDDLERILGLIK